MKLERNNIGRKVFTAGGDEQIKIWAGGSWSSGFY